MKIVTLRNNERTNYTPLRDPVSVAMAGIQIFSALKGIFGGGNAGGYDSTGKFIPGDINNRLSFFSQRLAQNGLTQNDIDIDLVNSFIYSPSGWQANIDKYVLAVSQDKKANPEKYVYTPTPGTISPGGGNVPMVSGLSNLNLTSLLMIGAGVFLVAQMLSTKRRR